MRIYHSGWHPDDIVSSDEKTLYDVAKFIQNFIIRTLFNAVVPRTNDGMTYLHEYPAINAGASLMS